MTTSETLTVLGGSCLLVLAIMGLAAPLVVVFVRRRKRALTRQAEAWEEAARRLGLAAPRPDHFTQPHRLSGLQGTVPVDGHWRFCFTSDGGTSRARTWTDTIVRARLEPPLELGLKVSWRCSTRADVPTGDPAVDARLALQATDRAALRALLQAGLLAALREALADLPPSWWRLDATDRAVMVRGGERYYGAETAVRAISVAARLADTLARLSRPTSGRGHDAPA